MQCAAMLKSNGDHLNFHIESTLWQLQEGGVESKTVVCLPLRLPLTLVFWKQSGVLQAKTNSDKYVA